MKIVLNSDVLCGDYARHGLPASVVRLAEECSKQGHQIVLPLTTMLEIEYRQAKKVAEMRQALSDAKGLLVERGVELPNVDPGALVPDVDVLKLFQHANPKIVVVDPTIQDYKDAHRRAALHELPHPPEIKSDEMRDLVIWAIAVRLSMENDSTMLVSKDEVHTHERGDAEANGVGLVRVSSIDDALDYLEVITPAGELLWSMLSPWLDTLKEKNLPLGLSPSLRSISNLSFVQGMSGPLGATGSVKIAGEGSKLIEADVVIALSDTAPNTVGLSNMRVAGAKSASIKISMEEPPTATAGSLDEKIQSLRDILGGVD